MHHIYYSFKIRLMKFSSSQFGKNAITFLSALAFLAIIMLLTYLFVSNALKG